jgi:hypothetical protein
VNARDLLKFRGQAEPKPGLALEPPDDPRLVPSWTVFQEAQALASQHGLTVTQHSERHYSLRKLDYGRKVWLLGFWPSNSRLWYDPKWPTKPPFLKLERPFTVLDVVKAAVAAEGQNR